MPTVALTIEEAVRLQQNIQGSFNLSQYEDDGSVPLNLDEQIAARLCLLLFPTMPSATQQSLIEALPDDASKAMLAFLACHHGCGLIPPGGEPLLPVVYKTLPSTNGTTAPETTQRFLPCLTPVGPGRCLHPGSHHAIHSGHCTHPGCDCLHFLPRVDTMQMSEGTETVVAYLHRVALAQKAPWDEHAACDALRRAWIPTEALASDWQAMLGRAFPALAEAIEGVSPL